MYKGKLLNIYKLTNKTNIMALETKIKEVTQKNEFPALYAVFMPVCSFGCKNDTAIEENNCQYRQKRLFVFSKFPSLISNFYVAQCKKQKLLQLWKIQRSHLEVLLC